MTDWSRLEGTSGPKPLVQQGYLKQAAHSHVHRLWRISKEGYSKESSIAQSPAQ